MPLIFSISIYFAEGSNLSIKESDVKVDVLFNTFLIYNTIKKNCFTYFLLIKSLRGTDIYSPSYGHLNFKGFSLL